MFRDLVKKKNKNKNRIEILVRRGLGKSCVDGSLIVGTEGEDTCEYPQRAPTAEDNNNQAGRKK